MPEESGFFMAKNPTVLLHEKINAEIADKYGLETKQVAVIRGTVTDKQLDQRAFIAYAQKKAEAVRKIRDHLDVKLDFWKDISEIARDTSDREWRDITRKVRVAPEKK